MARRASEIERALQLASSGACHSIWDLKQQLVKDGYSGDELYGVLLIQQLQERMARANTASEASRIRARRKLRRRSFGRRPQGR